MDERTLLVVDDNADLRRTAAEALRRKGYNVVEAENGIECVDLAKERRPDLILMDLMMPGLDGWAVARELGNDSGTARIPRVALSASAPVAAKHDPFAFRRILRKPVPLPDLIAVIQELLEEESVSD